MPAEFHPDRGELESFVAGILNPEDNRRVVRHLLSGCESCRRRAAEVWRPEKGTARDLAITRVARSAAAHEQVVERERQEAEALLAELDSHNSSRQALLARNSRRYQNWYVCERLIERAFDHSLTEPNEALHWAELAVELTRCRAEGTGALAVDYDLQARACGVLANARRISSDLIGAAEAFSDAYRALQLGSGDPLEEARLDLLHGLLHHGKRRFHAAFACFDRAARLCRLAGDDHLLGKVLTEKARSAGDAGDSDAMIRLLQRALGLLDADREPRAVLVAQHNLTWALKESGRLDEALATLQEILPLHARSAKAMDLLRLRWLEGKLAQAQGELERAEAAFREVHAKFVERRVPYDAALASLDLAAVLYQRGEIGEMKRLAAASLPVFRALGVHREALAALALFERAVRRERVSLRWIAELVAYLQRARSDPKLAFKPARLPT